jgi:dihydroorotase
VDCLSAVRKEAAPARRPRWPKALLSLALLASSAVHAQASYDLVLKGGHVIDPKNGIDAIRDVGIKNHKIA